MSVKTSGASRIQSTVEGQRNSSSRASSRAPLPFSCSDLKKHTHLRKGKHRRPVLLSRTRTCYVRSIAGVTFHRNDDAPLLAPCIGTLRDEHMKLPRNSSLCRGGSNGQINAWRTSMVVPFQCSPCHWLQLLYLTPLVLNWLRSR